MDSVNFTHKNHSVGLSQYHLEWCPKYRFNMMRSTYVKEFLIEVLHRIARDYSMLLHTVAVGNDHVHVFVSLPVTMTIEKAVNLFKGISAHELFGMFPGSRFRYPKGHYWSRGYFFRSVSNITSGTVKRYIENQQHDRLDETMSVNQLKLEVFNLERNPRL